MAASIIDDGLTEAFLAQYFGDQVSDLLSVDPSVPAAIFEPAGEWSRSFDEGNEASSVGRLGILDLGKVFLRKDQR